MAFLRAKPIGVMQMIDQGEQDDKVNPQHNFCGILASMGGCNACGRRDDSHRDVKHHLHQLCLP